MLWMSSEIHRPVTLGPDALNAMTKAQASVEDLTNQTEPTYGVNTGFGSLSRHRIDKEDLQQLQTNLIDRTRLGSANHFQSGGSRHDAPLGREFGTRSPGPPGRSHDAVGDAKPQRKPVIPSRGSVGASGDLAPLAHFALVLIGEGEVHDQSGTCSGKDALERIARSQALRRKRAWP